MLHPVRSGMTCASPKTTLKALPTVNFDIFPTVAHLQWEAPPDLAMRVFTSMFLGSEIPRAGCTAFSPWMDDEHTSFKGPTNSIRRS